MVVKSSIVIMRKGEADDWIEGQERKLECANLKVSATEGLAWRVLDRALQKVNQ